MPKLPKQHSRPRSLQPPAAEPASDHCDESVALTVPADHGAGGPDTHIEHSCVEPVNPELRIEVIPSTLTPFERVLRFLSLDLWIERRKARQAELEALFEAGRRENLSLQDLADYATAIGNKSATKMFTRMARRTSR